MRSLVVILALLVVVPSVGPASASVDGCATASTVHAYVLGTNLSLPLVVGSVASTARGCPNGGYAVSGKDAACPSSFAQACGPEVAAGAWISCTLEAQPGSLVRDLVVGIDADGDGHVAQGEPLVGMGTASLAPGTTYEFEFQAAATGQVIAYPVSALPGGSPFDLSRVLCFPFG